MPHKNSKVKNLTKKPYKIKISLSNHLTFSDIRIYHKAR